jgi:hypothetical protein
METRERERRTADEKVEAAPACPAPSPPQARILALQRSAGNRAVASRLSGRSPARVLARTGVTSLDDYDALPLHIRNYVEGPILSHLVRLAMNMDLPLDRMAAVSMPFRERFVGLLRARVGKEEWGNVVDVFRRAVEGEKPAADAGGGNDSGAALEQVHTVLKASALVPGSVKARLGDATGEGSVLAGSVSVHGMFDFAMAGAIFAMKTAPRLLVGIPPEFVPVAVEIGNLVGGTEAFTEAGAQPKLHVRAGRLSVHTVLHESIHALAADEWNAARWPAALTSYRFVLEGATEMLTRWILDSVGLPATVDGYPAERASFEQACRIGQVAPAEVAALYFEDGPMALAQRLQLPLAELPAVPVAG